MALEHHKIMKNHTRLLFFIVFLTCAQVYAGCSLGAPGVPAGTQTANSCPFKKEVTLPGCYKFSFTGCQGKGTALTNSGGGNNNNDDDDDDHYHHDDDDDDDDNGGSGGGGSTAGLRCKATVKDDKPTPKSQSCEVSFRDVNEFNKSPLKTTTIPSACIFRANKVPMKIKLTWECTDYASKPNGVFNILAEYQKDPPPPTGNLNFAAGSWLLVDAGTQPEGVAVITRE